MDLDYLFRQPPIREVLLECLAITDLFVLRYIVRWIPRPNARPLVKFAREGNLQRIKWAYNQWASAGKPKRKGLTYEECDTKAFLVAIEYNYFEVIEWAMRKRYFWPDYKALNTAARHGRFRMLKYFHAKGAVPDKHVGCPGMRHKINSAETSDPLVFAAAQSGKVKMLEWLRDLGYQFGINMFTHASVHGRAEAIEWLFVQKMRPEPHLEEHVVIHNKGTVLHRMLDTIYIHEGVSSARICERAALCDNIDALKWIRKKDLLISSQTATHALNTAIRYSSIEMIESLVGLGAELGDGACESAASNGLDVLKWVLAGGVQWNPNTCLIAARYGKADILEYAKECGLPFNRAECKAAIDSFNKRTRTADTRTIARNRQRSAGQ
jgi:hypothetical protein